MAICMASCASVRTTQKLAANTGCVQQSLLLGASIPWGNEAEIFIIPILGGNLAFLEETNVLSI